MKVAVVIVAGGSGNRLGGELPKQYYYLNGQAILCQTLEVFLNHSKITDVVVVIGKNDGAHYEACIHLHAKLLAPVKGGDTRQASVFSGLKALKDKKPDLVLVHDAARPFVSGELIDRVIHQLNENAGCIPALPVSDTVKKTDTTKRITATISRDHLWLAQTPQGFHYPMLLNAHEQFKEQFHFTDDASLFEALGLKVVVCQGDAKNIKITYPEDLTMMTKFSPDVRVGSGFDVHQLIPGGGMMILGVFIPGTLALKGHSDADVALHSLTDAIFGAIGDGDIGTHFPPTDPQWRGADSTRFLLYALERMKQRGGRLNHVDITLIGEKPKFSPYREQFLASLETLLKISPERIGIKATTTEKLGFLGRGEGLAVQATATVIFE
ncbi:bifunctional 2-C-methyl-D-erythritol 4-phosphate cytidylyltransferase/2-C-methyl-D-erythritol 2,4-cyclodiphosphate synthase [Candidatus Paracaedibacter symbiosus]|uniref:bifunctional 2-C-methyl-D-erythritol 4-phosphate cytidylyltransferase/2-C-methyl-D-erythritol 2,4-cyclodiphosphate synthase n=1 Tax=Candidatus Paracaedibacter symbiosus TaxID=244582 RepID=UPI000509A673|nr:bifunctional 2-C-methyl-D-erythritol 4-phosphate cytidylyltransferase/2-C-methyl-D-erythritol 2,4-cyclodiphosphate synthase [Candidatus Paracaedibacter symbiosus]